MCGHSPKMWIVAAGTIRKGCVYLSYGHNPKRGVSGRSCGYNDYNPKMVCLSLMRAQSEKGCIWNGRSPKKVGLINERILRTEVGKNGVM